LLAGAGLALVLVLPGLLDQASRTSEYRWSDETVLANSARGSEWFQLDHRAAGAGVLPWNAPAPAGEQRLFPGTALLCLALVGLVMGARSAHRRWVWFLAAVATGAAVLALGTAVEPFGPFSILRDLVPGFDRLRSPFRFAAVTQIALVVLAGLGLDALWLFRGALGRAVAVGIFALGVLEVAALPARLTTVHDTTDAAWVRWLARHPGGAVAMAPFPTSGSYVDYATTTEWMLAGLEHGHPLLNGYSGFFPDRYLDLRRRMLDFPDPTSVHALVAEGATYVVVDHAWLTPQRRHALAQSHVLSVAFEVPGALVLRLDH
jgi:hypothetical protein